MRRQIRPAKPASLATREQKTPTGNGRGFSFSGLSLSEPFSEQAPPSIDQSSSLNVERPSALFSNSRWKGRVRGPIPEERENRWSSRLRQSQRGTAPCAGSHGPGSERRIRCAFIACLLDILDQIDQSIKGDVTQLPVAILNDVDALLQLIFG